MKAVVAALALLPMVSANTFADRAALKAQVDTCCDHWSKPWDTTDPVCDDIENWDVSAVTDMSNLFVNMKQDFNRDLSAWDVSSVTTFELMFDRAKKFNQDLSSWQIKSDANLRLMFAEAEDFCQQLCGDAWVNHVGNQGSMFAYIPTCANDASFPKIEACTLCAADEKALTTNIDGECEACPAGKVSRAGQTICVTPPPPAECADATTPTAYQSMGCCSC
jgi:hypothetical protein